MNVVIINRIKKLLTALAVYITIVTACMLAGCAVENDPPPGDENKVYSVIYAVNDENGGFIRGDAEQQISEGGDGKIVTAVALYGYKFEGWSDGYTGATRSEKNVWGDVTFTAKFEQIITPIEIFSVTYVAADGGIVEGKTEQKVVRGERSESVTAVADEAYRFIGWSDGESSATRSDVIDADGFTATALFEEIIIKVRYTVASYGGKGGKIQGKTEQTVKWKGSAESVTAVAENGFEFVAWSDGYPHATRTDTELTEDLTLSASFAQIVFAADYAVNDSAFGRIQTIPNSHGESVNIHKVKAVPIDGCVFIGWSDGVTSAERCDVLKADLSVTANFGVCADYEVANERGGRIAGIAHQTVLPDGNFTRVRAIPDTGYVFCGWSDLVESAERCDEQNRKSINRFAYFEPIERTYKYDYGAMGGAPLVGEVTINRNALENAVFTVPTWDGHIFCGWYTEKEFIHKAVDAQGNYMLGDQGFSVESDTMYARWKQTGGEYPPVYSILFVMVDTIDATLYSVKDQLDVTVKHKMPVIERLIVNEEIDFMEKQLNEWFGGEVEFELDIYYTVDRFTENQYSPIDTPNGTLVPDIRKISELKDVYGNYINTLTMLDYGYENINLYTEFNRGKDYNSGYLSVFMQDLLQKYELHELLQSMRDGDEDAFELKSVLIRNLAKSVADNEENWANDLTDYLRGSTGSEYDEKIKAFLLNKAYLNGQTVGIPMEWWTHELDIHLRCDGFGGNYKYSYYKDGDGNVELTVTNLNIELPFGTEITLEALPYSGYKFVKWSDGVQTAVRHDIMMYNVRIKPIFEKIDQ